MWGLQCQKEKEKGWGLKPLLGSKSPLNLQYLSKNSELFFAGNYMRYNKSIVTILVQIHTFCDRDGGLSQR